MSLEGKNFGIVCQRNLGHVAIFDTDNLTLLYDIPLPPNNDGTKADPVDIVITPDRSKALVTSFNNRTLYTIDLTKKTPSSNNGVIFPKDFLRDIDITPDGKFAVTVDGDPSGQHYIESFDVQNQTFLPEIVEKADAIAVSKNGNDRVYATRSTDHMLMVFNLNTTTGELTNPKIAVDSGGLEPLNVTLSSDCKFAFVLNSKKTGQSTRNIAVFDITADTPVFKTTVPLYNDNIPQSAVVSCNGYKLYVLTSGTLGGNIEIFDVTSTAPFLTHFSNIPLLVPIFHNDEYTGIDQIALSQSEKYVFVSNKVGSLTAFNTETGLLSAIDNLGTNGGVYTKDCFCPYVTTPVPTTPAPTTPAPTTSAPITTPAPTTPTPTTPAPTIPAPTPAPCQCCFATPKPVSFEKCQLTVSETITTTVDCVGRFLDIDVFLTNVCPNKFVNIGVLVYEGNNLITSKVCRLFTDSTLGTCIANVFAGKFCFVFDESSCPLPRTFIVKIVANYVEI